MPLNFKYRVRSKPLLALAAFALVSIPASAQVPAVGFVAPFAIAVGPRDEIYVADPGAQRIFQWSPGSLREIAGSGIVDHSTGMVKGDFQDGPVSTARFNRPLGLAVAQDGSILVADSGNRCIRKIKDGFVSTVAGDVSRTAPADGPSEKSAFAWPTSIVADGSDIYIADYGGGVRYLSADGVVSTIDTPTVPKTVRAIGVGTNNRRTTLFEVVGQTGNWSAIETQLNKTKPVPSVGEILNLGELEHHGLGEGDEAPFGYPSSVFLLSSYDFVFTDPVWRTVRYGYSRSNNTPLKHERTIRLTGLDFEDASGRGNLGSSSASGSFALPSGVAVLSDGRPIVVDSIARSVTILPKLDRRHPVSDAIADLNAPSTSYRVAFVSNSFAYYDTTYANSIGNVIENTLNASEKSTGLTRPVVVKTIRLAPIDISTTTSYIESYLADGNFDLVVLMLNSAHLGRELEYHPEIRSGDYRQSIADNLKETREKLLQSTTKFTVALIPQAGQVSDLEGGWAGDLNYNIDANSTNATNDDRAMLALSGVDVIDMYSAFGTAEARSIRTPFNGSLNEHPSIAGMKLAGETIAQGLIASHPWR